MSCYLITMERGHKVARSITTREEYLALRNSQRQILNIKAARNGDDKAKRKLLQFNYSCIPSPTPTLPREGDEKSEKTGQNRGCDPSVVSNTLPPSGGMGWGLLKGCKTPSNSVGMDVDLDPNLNPNPNEVKDLILSKKEELGLLMLERSVNKGYHLVFRRHPELSNEENLKWASNLLGVEYDKGAKDITRVFFTTSASEEDLLFLDDEIFENNILTPALSLKGEGDEKFDSPVESARDKEGDAIAINVKAEPELLTQTSSASNAPSEHLTYNGIPYSAIVKKWWEFYNDGKEPCPGNRNTLTFELAVNLRNICGFDRDLMNKVIPDYWDPLPTSPRGGVEKTDTLGQEAGCDPSVVSNTLPPSGGSGWGREKLACIDSALSEKRTQMPKRLKEVLEALRLEMLNSNTDSAAFVEAIEEALCDDEKYYYNQLPRMPMGIKDSIDAVGPSLAMPVLTAICPAIGALATGVSLDVHRKVRNLNLISYIAGDFASGKGSIDPVVDAWMSEVKAFDKMYQMQEDEWRAKKRAAKNKKEQPEEPKLPVRCLTLNNTVANLAERLANTEGKHAFSFTPEADTVAQKWKSAMSDFSVMLRQSYDGTCYEREAKSADAVNVHIDKLLWNVTMCGTPDALYRVINNYTDGFQSRVAVARTPDNTFAPLEDNPPTLTTLQEEHIRQVAHLLPLMHGEVTLDKLEKKGREWVETVRMDTLKDNDKIKARQRFRVCVTAQRMTCCLLLCKVCEQLIEKYGLNGAETRLKQNPNLWKEMLKKAQTLPLLNAYDVIADSLIDNALHFFRDRIDNAFSSQNYKGSMEGFRTKSGRNDSIYERLDVVFSFDQALQQSIAIKGSGITKNSVQQMIKNWIKQGLAERYECKYKKTSFQVSH